MTITGEARFDEATFSDVAEFRGATFAGAAWFVGATFGAGAAFEDVTITGEARFDEATFSDVAEFRGATFGQAAWFVGATFGAGAAFEEAEFTGDAGFGEVTFKGAGFDGATFREAAWFNAATFGEDASFDGATFGGNASFDTAAFGGDAGFAGATFDQARDFGPVFVGEGLVLDAAMFAQSLRMEVSALRVSCVRTVFRAGADMLVRRAEVVLDDADFAEQSSVAELLPATSGPEGSPRRLRPGDPPDGFAPRLVALRRANVARLTVAGVDVQACRFAEAAGLDGLRIERAPFAQVPAGWHTTPAGWRGRYTRRRTVAEEHHWRRQRADRSGLAHHASHGKRWYEDDLRPPDWLPETSEPPDPSQIADVYRELRKQREDKKDEPGAADFYYGEMEMRRHSAPLAERFILSLYWLVSGYGLRASRALLALAVTILLGALLLHLFGFDMGKHPDDGPLLFSVESSISLFRAPQGALTPAGHVIQIVLRLAGPLFFGLALLALRGRVKR